MKQLLFVLFFLFYCFHHANSQKVQTVLLLDRDYYCAGDIVFGMFYVNEDLAKSKVVRFEIRNLQDSLIFHTYGIINENNKAEFQTKLPYSIKTGTYIVTVMSAIDQPIDIVVGKFVVINAIEDENPTNFNDINLINHNKGINFKLIEKNTTEIEVNIDSDSQPLCVLISDQDHSPGLFFGEVNNKEDIRKWSDKIFYLGNVKNNGKPIRLNLIGAYVNQDQTIYLSKSNDSGEFLLKLPLFTGIKNIQIIPYPMEVEFITLHESRSKYEYLLFKKDVPEQLFKKYKLRKKIDHYFDNNQLCITHKTNAFTNKIGPGQKVFNVSNYLKFEDVREFCKENSNMIQFKGDGKNTKMLMDIPESYSKQFGYKSENPLCLLNGFLVKNIDAVSKIKTKNVKGISLHYNLPLLKKNLSVFGDFGLFEINTRLIDNILSLNEKQNIITLNGIPNENNSPSKMTLKTSKKFLMPTNFFECQEMTQNLQIKVNPDGDYSDKKMWILVINKMGTIDFVKDL